MPIDFSDHLLEQARRSLERLHDFMRRLQNAKSGGVKSSAELPELIKAAQEKFEKAMDDDFEISQALAAVFDFVKNVNVFLDSGRMSQENVAAANKVMRRFDEVLAVLKIEEDVRDSEIEKLIAERSKARENKDFARADEIRRDLEKQGIILEDSASGTIWKKAL